VDRTVQLEQEVSRLQTECQALRDDLEGMAAHNLPAEQVSCRASERSGEADLMRNFGSIWETLPDPLENIVGAFLFRDRRATSQMQVRWFREGGIQFGTSSSRHVFSKVVG
jgi:hypothetical protein